MTKDLPCREAFYRPAWTKIHLFRKIMTMLTTNDCQKKSSHLVWKHPACVVVKVFHHWPRQEPEGTLVVVKSLGQSGNSIWDSKDCQRSKQKYAFSESLVAEFEGFLIFFNKLEDLVVANRGTKRKPEEENQDLFKAKDCHPESIITISSIYIYRC